MSTKTLRSLREAEGLTLDDIAGRLGRDGSWVSRLENGGTPRFIESIGLAAAVAEAYGVEVEAIPRLIRRIQT